MSNFSRYQQNVIRRYYDNREGIALQRAQELVTELYLAEGKKREKHWKNLAGHLESLGVKPAQIAHLIEKDNPELAAKMIQDLINKK